MESQNTVLDRELCTASKVLNRISKHSSSCFRDEKMNECELEGMNLCWEGRGQWGGS